MKGLLDFLFTKTWTNFQFILAFYLISYIKDTDASAWTILWMIPIFLLNSIGEAYRESHHE